MTGLSLLALATVNGYHGYVLFAWLYGFCLGGYQYAVHQYTLDRVRARQFARGWSLVLAVRALPTLFGVPIAGTHSIVIFVVKTFRDWLEIRFFGEEKWMQ